MSKYPSLFIALFLLCFSGYTQSLAVHEEYSIDVLNVRQGLISNFVTKVVSDENNLKFFATEGGISKFDGYNFSNFRPGEQFPGLENENIETLFADETNHIWIGTKEGGLSVMDTRNNSIRNMNHLFGAITKKKLRVISLNKDSKGTIWVGTWSNGLFLIDPKDERLISHFPSEQPIYSIIKDQYQNIWYITGKGLYKFDPSENRKIRFETNRIYFNLVEDASRDKIWLVGNNGKNIALGGFDFATQLLTEEILPIEARFVKSIALDKKNRLWLGSWGDGLYISDDEVSEFQKINTNPQGGNLENINYQIILSIDIDENGIAWLGTSHGGVLVLYPNKGFQIARNVGNENISDHNITGFFKSAKGVSLKGTLTEGLFGDRGGAGFTRISAVSPTKVNTFFEKGEQLYVGTGNGFYLFQNGDFAKPKQYLKNQKITAMLVDSQDRLWVGTQQMGLKMLKLDGSKLASDWQVFTEEDKKHPISSNRISQIKEDDQGRIWIGTYSGINLLDERTMRFTSQLDLLPDGPMPSIVNDMHFAGDELYLATPKGLIVMHYGGEALELKEVFDVRSGLTNDFICAIEEDLQGHLWISSTTSLSKFNPNEQNFINYDREDGVMINSFHINSSFRDADGLLYFGGANGLLSFDPMRISEGFLVPEVVFTKLIVNNKTLHVGDQVDGKVILVNTIENTAGIELDYSQNHLSLTFAVNDFLGVDNIFYSYRLKGLSEEWVNLGSSNQISFTGLRSGEYELILRASRNSRDWGPSKSLHVHIARPPWLTWWAFLGYFIFGVGLLLLIRYVSGRQARLEAKLRIIQIEKEKEHELNEAKITFFTNISHEFRTPLTLILSPVTELLADLNLRESVQEKLLLVESNGKRMLRLINQLLDFRKSEHGLLRLNLSRSDFVSFSREVFLSFRNLALKKQIAYSFDSEEELLMLDFDRNQMEIVLCNLLSNAFKYTPDHGKISLQISINEGQVLLSLRDDGIGMRAEEAERVFDRFYQVQNAESSTMVGSGIGLAFSKNIIELHQGAINLESTTGKGTCIRFTLPRLSQGIDSIFMDSDSSDPREEFQGLDFEQTNLLIINQKLKETSILIADDNEDIRLYLRSLLAEDYEVWEAEDGEQALELIHKEMPDLVISDVMMPKMDGMKLCHEIKSQISTSHIPVILLTARTSIAYEMDGLQTGAEDYITKPFNPGIVITRVRNILENRRKLQEYFLNKVRFEPDTNKVSETNLDAQFIEKAIALVNANLLNEDFGIDTMVDQLNMSQSTLFRKIKSLTGLSTTAFIRSVKLKKAAQLILQSDTKLSQIAYEVGFNDYKYFKKSFQQQFSCLPSEYKALILRKIE